jgi:hypothetical protein
VGAVGGYIQGAAHGPASHAFGLATDQVLEYKVVLASGKLVTANACQYEDLFTTFCGGGGGTYGVVVSATITAHPTRAVLQHKFEIAPKTRNQSFLIGTVAGIVSKFSTLSDEGFAGIGEFRHNWGSAFLHAQFWDFAREKLLLWDRACQRTDDRGSRGFSAQIQRDQTIR